MTLIIINDSLTTREIAHRIARSENAMPLLSIEGFVAGTDDRRQSAAHETAMCAFDHLRQAKALFGFVATKTAAPTRLDWALTRSSTK